jgi:regulator of replication initiation timing
MPKRDPTSAEYEQVLAENDALRIENVGLRRELKSKDQTIDRLELADRARSKRMGELHDQIYQLGFAKARLEIAKANLEFDNKRLLEKLTEQQQSIIDQLQLKRAGPDILGEVLEAARIKDKA